MKEKTRKGVVAVGIASLAGGVFALLGARGMVTGVTVLFVAAGGAVGATMAYLAYQDWSSTPTIPPPDVERATEFPAPGDDFDRTLAQFDGSGTGHLPDRRSIHRRLTDLAARVLARNGAYTDEAARTAVENGEWPGDPDVAAFLQNPDTTLQRTWSDRVRERIDRDDDPSDFQRLVARTVDAIADRSEVVDLDPDAGESVVNLRPDTGTREGRTTPRQGSDAGRRAETESPTGRWRGMVPVSAAFVGFGFLLREPAVILAGAVAAGFVVYSEASAPAAVTPVVERSVDAANPDPGDEVEVTTTVCNESDRVVPDLSLVDGVPDGLAVSDGSPRFGTALRPGESASFTYSVTARRGVHEFGPAYTVVRGVADSTARVELVGVEADSDATLSVAPALDAFPFSVPLYEQTGEHLGRHPAGGGEGTEFHSTREYRPGDSMSRIDWKHLARSADDELTTVRYRQQRAASVALVVDVYSVAYLATGSEDHVVVDQSVVAASRLAGSLLDDGDQVGIAALGDSPLWVTPDVGLDHRRRITELLATDPAFPPVPPQSGEYRPRWVREFHRRYPTETQVILLSPLCDRRYPFLIRQFRGFGHPVTVISPDPTVDRTVGQRLTRVERRLRIETLRENGVRVIDWDPTESLAVAVGRAAERWSR